MPNKLICITGMPGAGKSVVSDMFVAKGYQFIRFGQIVLDEVIRRGIEPSEENQKMIREQIRKDHGMAAMALLNLPNFDSLLENGNVIADGLYSFEEYKLLKKHFGEKVVVIATYSPPQLRYDRISQRVSGKEDVDLRNHEFTKEEAEQRDFHELENLNKGATIAMADYTILNTKDLAFLQQQVHEVMEEVGKS